MTKEILSSRKLAASPWGKVALAAMIFLAGAGAGKTQVSPIPVNFDLTNNTGMSGSQIWVQFLGGQPVAGTYTDYNGVQQQLYANTAYSLDQLANAAGTSNLAIDNFSGRIYVNYGAYGLEGMSNPAYTPAAATPNDPNYSTRYQYFETTIISNAGNTGGRTIFADLSYIDFTAISLSMQAVSGSTGQVYPNSVINNANQVSAPGQQLINQALSSAVIPGQAVLPIGASTSGSGFARVISPQYTVDSGTGAVYPSFQGYLDSLNGKTVTIAGTFVGTAPENTPQTVQQAYYYTGSFVGTGTGGHFIMVSNTNVTGRTDYSWMTSEGTGVNPDNTISISYVDLLDQKGIYGNNPNYTLTSGTTVYTSTTGISNDMYGRAIGDVLAGLSLGYVGSTVTGTIPTSVSNSGSTSYGSTTAFGDMPSSLWWASGQAFSGTTYIPLANGSDYLAVEWNDTPAAANYVFSAASGTNTNYNAYAAALALNQSGTGYGTNPYTTGYGFPLQDRLGNNLLSYSTDQNPDAVLRITVNFDGTAPLATGIWTSGSSGSWLNAANWSGSTIPIDGASAQFVGSSTSAMTVSTGSNQNLSGLYFNYRAGTFVIQDNTITLSGNIVNSSTNTQTINSDLVLGSAGTVYAAFGGVNIGGDIDLGNTGTGTVLAFAGTSNTVVTGVISGSGGLAKFGLGSVTLSGSNTFLGGFKHQDGTLVVGNDSALGTGLLTLSSATAVNAVLQATNGDRTLANAVSLNGDITVSGSNGITFSGPVAIQPTPASGTIPAQGATPTLTNTADVSFNGVISEVLPGSGFIKDGSGTMTLGGSSANTFTGSLAVNDGTLVFAKTSGTAFGGNLTVGDGAGAAGSAVAKWNASNQTMGVKSVQSGSLTSVVASNVTVNTDGQLNLQNFNDTIGSLTLYGGSVIGSGTLTLAGTSSEFAISSTTSGTSYSPGNVNFLGTGSSSAQIAANLVMNGAANGSIATFNVAKSSAPVGLTVTGAVSGTAVTKAGGGVLAVEQNNVDGQWIVTQGILRTASATGAEFSVAGGGLGAISTGTTTQTIDVKSLTVSSTGGVFLGLGATRSDTINITQTASGSVNIADDTIFFFRDAGMVLSGSSVAYSLVTGVSGAWSGTPSALANSLTFLSSDISGLVGSFSYSDGTLSFTGTRGVSATWGADAGSSDWGTAANWTGGAVPDSGANLIFGPSSETSVNTTAARSVGSLTFTSSAAAYSLSGSSITLSGNLVNSSTNTQTIANTLVINGTREVDAAAGNIELGSIALSPTPALPGTLIFTGSGNTTVSGLISDGLIGSGTALPPVAAGGSITMNGTGTLALTGSNSFQGAVNFDDGVISVASLNSLGNLTATRDFNFNGGALEIGTTGTISQIQNVYLNADSAISVVGSSSLTVATALTGDGGLTKEGTGTLALSYVNPTSANAYKGKTIVNDGVLSVDYAKALGSVVQGTEVKDGGTLLLDNSEVALVITGESLKLSGTGYQGNGALRVISGSSSWNAPVVAEKDAKIQVEAAGSLGLQGVVNTGSNNLTLAAMYSSSDNGLIALNGQLVGSGTLTATGGGYVIANGQSGTLPAFTGRVNVTDATVLMLQTNSGLGSGASSVTVADGSSLQFVNQSQGGMQVAFDQITLSGTGVSNVLFSSYGAINNNTVGLTTLTGNMALDDDALIYVSNGALQADGNINLNQNTLTINSEVGQVTLNGVISGSGGITTTSKGVLYLTGNNTYSGSTSIGVGTAVMVSSSSALGTGSAVVASGASLQISSTSGITIGNELYIAGSGVGSAGALVNVSGSNTVSGSIQLTAGSPVVTAASGELVLSGTVNGADLSTQGPGTVNLTGVFTGNTVSVNSGVFASGSMSAVNMTLTSGSATYSPGGSGTIEQVALNSFTAVQGNILLDVGATTSDSIYAPGMNISGTMGIVLNNLGFTGSSTTYSILNSGTSAAINVGAGALPNISSVTGIAGITWGIELATDDGAPPGLQDLLKLTIVNASSTWLDESGDGQWDTGSNWESPIASGTGIVPGQGSAVSFTGTSGSVTNVQTGADRLVGGLAFSASSTQINITGNTITVFGEIRNDSSVLQSISSNLALQDNTVANAAAGNLSLSGTMNLGVSTLTVSGSNHTTISGRITGGTAGEVVLVKSGSGSLTVSGTSDFVGVADVSGGMFILDGSLGSGASITIDEHGVLAGTGSTAGTVTVAGTLEPGHSPGNLQTGAQTWLDGGDYNWQILDATGTAGTGYDLITITGQLNLSNLTDWGFSINLWSLSDPNTSGAALHFNDALNQSWTLVSTTAGVVGFDAANFAIHAAAFNGTDGFANLFTGSFSVSVNGNDLMLNYTAVPEPSTWGLLAVSVLVFAGWRRSRSRQAGLDGR